MKVGKRTYTFPSGLRFAHGTQREDRVLWVYDAAHGGTVHCFVESGEVMNIPPALLSTVAQQVFGVTT